MKLHGLLLSGQILRTLFSILIILILAALLYLAQINPSQYAKKQSNMQGALKHPLIPLHFEPIPGQTEESTRYIARSGGYTLSLGPGEAVITCRDPQFDSKPSSPLSHACTQTIRLQLCGADARSHLTGREKLPGRSHYFIGNDPADWHTDIPHYAKVAYQKVYPGIDLVYYGRDGQMEFDFIVAPGGDPQDIVLQVDGSDRPKIDEQGTLLLAGSGCALAMKPPLAYQDIEGIREIITAEYSIHSENQVRFVLGEYDPEFCLVIDPVLSYATYLGGSKTDAAYSIAVDEEGCAYVTGSTISTDFPTKSAFQPDLTTGMFSNLSDVFVTKLNREGTEIVYSTYLGGRWDDSGTSIAVDAQGRACLTGRTSSNDDAGTSGYEGFPVKNAFQEKIGDPNKSDAFITVLDPYGGLYYSTYLGGGYEDYGTGIAVDRYGCVYVTGSEFSADFPVKNAYLSKKPGYYFDAFVTKIDPAQSGAASLLYSTHLGGTADTYGNAIAVDGEGCAYVTGKTSAADFPTLNAIQSAYQGKGDIFVSKIDPARSGAASLIYSTFLGNEISNEGLDIAVDASGRAVVAGFGPVLATPGAFTTPGSSFISKLTASGNGFVWSARPYSARKLAMDLNGNVYATSTYLTLGGGAGLMALNPDGADTLFTYKLIVAPVDVAAARNGDLHLAGSTSSPDFPTQNPYQSGLAGSTDAFVVKLAAEVKKTIVVTPDPVFFPLTLPGEISRKIVEIASSGGEPVEIVNIEVEPVALFALEDVPALPLTLDSGEKIELQIVYAPTAAVQKVSSAGLSGTGALTVTSDADEPVTTIPLLTAGIIVNDTGDASDYDLDDGICDTDAALSGNQCTLRAAIENVNNLGSSNPTTVYFRIPGNAPYVIEPRGALPPVAYPVHFDILAGDAPVLLSGDKAGLADGLVIESGNCLVKNILFEKWRGNGLRVIGGEWNVIEKCVFRNNGYQLTDKSHAGLLIEESASNRIRNNLIYDNNAFGIQMRGETSQMNVIEENRIGYNGTGAATKDKQNVGIYILNGNENRIRSNEVGKNSYGIAIEGAPAKTGKAVGNLIQANQIGSDKKGMDNYGNRLIGILVSGAEKTVIEDNLISWNGDIGSIRSAGLKITGWALETEVRKNKIGPDLSGLAAAEALGNQGSGVDISNGVSHTHIIDNLISANRGGGIFISSEEYTDEPVHHTTIERNIIGLDANGDQILSNHGTGITMSNRSHSNSIQSNTISGNRNSGIALFTGSAMNVITDNKIGTDSSGTIPAPNGESGIFTGGSSNFFITGNTISGNTDCQIHIISSTPGNIFIMNNIIGPAITGQALKMDEDKIPDGIWLFQASALVEENQIACNATGIKCDYHTNADISKNMIHHNKLGLMITDSPVLVAMNAIHENERGIDADNAEALKAIIAGNEIYHNFGLNSGIHLTHANAAIYGNYIHHDAGDGITIAGIGSPVIQKNILMDNKGFGVNHLGSAVPVDARYNYWNDAGGPGGAGPGSGDRVSSGVDYGGWRREAVTLFVYPERDTVLLKTGKQDQVTLYFQNWSMTNDEVTYSVHAEKNWVTPDQTRMIRLGSALGAADLVRFSVPASTPEGSTAGVEVRAASTLNPAHRDTVRFVVIAGSMALHQVMVIPDSVAVFPGDSVRFAVQGYDQFAGSQAIQPLWQCTSGVIDHTGLFIAGNQTGQFAVTVSDSASGVSAQARVWIVEDTGVSANSGSLPLHYYLSQNYPNPFNQSTRIHYAIPRPSAVRVEIFNIQGRKVRTLVDHFHAAGSHALNWDGCDEQGRAVAGGIYLYQIRTPNFASGKKMVLLR